jgi:hypothetical protein
VALAQPRVAMDTPAWLGSTGIWVSVTKHSYLMLTTQAAAAVLASVGFTSHPGVQLHLNETQPMRCHPANRSCQHGSAAAGDSQVCQRAVGGDPLRRQAALELVAGDVAVGVGQAQWHRVKRCTSLALGPISDQGIKTIRLTQPSQQSHYSALTQCEMHRYAAGNQAMWQ